VRHRNRRLIAIMAVGLWGCSDGEAAGPERDSDTEEGAATSGSGGETVDDGQGPDGADATTGDEATGGADDADPTDDGGEPPQFDCEGFDARTVAWALPPGATQSNFAPFSNESCDSDPAATWHTTVDVDGDGNADLVVTNICDGTSDPGTTGWDVYFGGEDGFAPTPSAWSLPGGFPASDFVRFHEQDCDTDPDESWHTTRDIDGDGFVDLVVTNICDGTPDPGTTGWDVYFGGAAGFSGTPSAWSLPSGFPASEFVFVDKASCDVDPSESWHTTRDLDGDGFVDLLVTNLCDGSSDPGTSAWDVYPGGPQGFAATAIQWSLPAGYPASNFVRLEQLSCEDDPAASFHIVTDLDGDGRLDLVVTNRCDGTAEPGTTSWEVHLGEDGGFAATGVDWLLPPGFPTSNFAWPSRQACDEDPAQSFHSLLEVTGDGRPDLVVTNLCDGTADPGTTRWDVYAGREGGFASDAIAWPLPPAAPTSNYARPAQQQCGEDPAATWHVTTSLAADAGLELVITNVCDGTADPGTTQWRVHRSVCVAT
jgi:hypothetical protein